MRESQYSLNLQAVLQKPNRWRRHIVRFLACVVVFCTTYALILPAITMQRKTVCGLTEHSHSDDCYALKLVCGLEEDEGHVHDEQCYETLLTCPLEEREGHFHSEDCYVCIQTLICGLEESDEHVHCEDCYAEETVLICGQEEREGHVHGEDCYTRTLICGQEEREAHVHGKDCWERVPVCGLEEHEHTEACYEMKLEEDEDEKELRTFSKHYDVKLLYDEKAKIPAGAQLVVTEYAEGSKEYQRALDLVLESKRAADEAFDEDSLGFAAMDISLFDANGRKIEPRSPVRLAITLRELPDGMTAEEMLYSMEVRHLVEMRDSMWVRETVTAYSKEEDGSIEAQKDSVTATIAVDSLSPFTISWRISNWNTANIQLHYYDTEGNDISDIAVPTAVQVSRPNDGWINLTGSNYAVPVQGYTFRNVKYNDVSVDWLYLVTENRQNVAYFYQAGTQNATRVVLQYNATLHVYFYYEANAAPPAQSVSLRLRYVDENSELQQLDLSAEATEAGTVIDLSDAEHRKSFDGHTFQSLACGDKQGFDAVELKLVNSGGTWSPVCFFLSNGAAQAETNPFTPGEPMVFTYRYTTDALTPPPQSVTLRLRYVDESAELQQTDVTLNATASGTVIDLSDAGHLPSFDGHTFQSLVCGDKQNFDAVEVKLVENGGTWSPVCFFLTSGVAQAETNSFTPGVPMEFVYTYTTDPLPPEPGQPLTLRLHYRNADGELSVQDFAAEATSAGNRVFLKTTPYLKAFENNQFKNITCHDFQDFDTVELLVDHGALGCAFLKNGLYLTNGYYTGYQIENGVLEIDMNYEPVSEIAKIRLNHVYYHENSMTVLGDGMTLDLPIDGTADALDLYQYILSDLGNKKFAGLTCTLANGTQAYAFDSIKALQDPQDGKIFELYSDGNYAGRSSIVGDIVITYNYVDNDDSSGGWHGGGIRPGGGTKPLPEPNLGELPDAQAEKTLTDNADGTYTVTLSMQVPQISAQSSSRANVVVIYDSSNSMHEPVDGNTWVRDDQHGTYAEYQGKYYQLASFGSNIRKIFSFVDDQGVTHTLGADQPNNGIYCGPKYLPTRTRMDVARSATKYLGSELLQLNSASDPDRIEIAFVEFASDVIQVQQPTTDLANFNSWVNNCSTYIEQTQNGGDLRGGTNWDAALRIASGQPYDGHPNAVQFSDDDQIYIVFITDGNPTARTTPDGLISGSPDDSSGTYDDGARIGSTGLFGGVTPGVYGTGNSDTKGYNFNRAEDQAARIVDVDKSILFNVGIFGDADKMQLLTNNGYFEGSDEASLQAAFDNIVGQTFSRMGYTNLNILDGITSMTSSTLIHGDPNDFIYKVTDEQGNDVTDVQLKPEQRNAQFTLSPGDPNEDGVVTWALGAEDLLLPGGTYSVSFVVWPSQEAYDLVSDLNNGMRSFASLSSVEQSQVVGSGPGGDQAPFSLRTNTRQSVTYSTGKYVKDSMGNETITYGLPEQAPLQTPDPMPLTDTQIHVQKTWDVSLDPTELADFLAANPGFLVELDLMKGSQVYVGDIQIEPTAGLVWPDSLHPDGYHISTGLMVSEACAAASGIAVTDNAGNPYYPTTNFNGTTYYILESGRNYSFREDEFDIHFELEDRVYHPMVVDGVLMDVGFANNGTVLQMLPFSNTLSATNGLRGSINVVKHIVDQNGLVIDDDKESIFTVQCSITLNGQPLTGLEYRYYYEDGSKSDKVTVSDSTNIVLPLKVGETLRFVNVPNGCAYSVSELIDSDLLYRFVSITGSSMTKDGSGNEIPADSSGFSNSADGKTLYGVSAVNAAQQVEIKNTYRAVSVEITKTDMSGNLKLSGAEFGLYTELDTDGTGTVRAKDRFGVDVPTEETNTDGKIVFQNLPPGIYYLVEEKPPDGYSGLSGPITLQIGNTGMSYQIPGGENGHGTPVLSEDETVFSMSVKNSRGYSLPDTGGPGPELFRFCGIALIAVTTFCYWCARRRRQNE